MADITVDITAPDWYLLKTTRRIGMLSYKSAKVRFEHRTTVQGIKIPSEFRLTDDPLSRSFTQFYLSDGNQSITLTGKVEAEFTNTDFFPDQAEVLIAIEAVDRYWNKEDHAWQVGFYANRFELQDTYLTGNKVGSEVSVNIDTALIPDLAGDSITVTFYVARNYDDPTPVIADFTDFKNFQFTLENAAVQEGQSTAIDYRLTQQTDARGRYDDRVIWFGDGPVAYARSAITRDEAGEQLTSEWRYAGESGESIIHANILLREIMDMQRSEVRGLTSDLLGEYKPCQIIDVDSFFHFFIGGNQNGRDNLWQANLFRVNRVIDAFIPPESLSLFFSASITGTNEPGKMRIIDHTYNESDVLSSVDGRGGNLYYGGLGVHPTRSYLAYGKTGFGTNEWPWARVYDIDNAFDILATWGESNNDDRYVNCLFTEDRFLLLADLDPITVRAYDLDSFTLQESYSLFGIDGSDHASSDVSNGGYIFVCSNTGTSQDELITAYDLSTSTQVWQNGLGDLDGLPHVIALPENECIVVHAGIVRKYGATGNLIWSKAYATFNPKRRGIVAGWDGSFYIAGDHSDNSSTGLNKFDANGDRVWNIKTGIGRAPSVGVDSNGRILVYSRTNSRYMLYNTDGTFLSQTTNFNSQPIIEAHPGKYGMFGPKL